VTEPIQQTWRQGRGPRGIRTNDQVNRQKFCDRFCHVFSPSLRHYNHIDVVERIIRRITPLAQQQCSNCHVIGKNETNAAESQPSGPDFITIKGLKAATLKARLNAPHPVMSKFPELNDQQIDDLVAYISSLKSWVFTLILLWQHQNYATRSMIKRTNALGICRRQFWQHAILSTVAASLGLKAEQARAQQSFKMSKKQAGYITRNKYAAQTCAQCLYFISPNDCVIVQGPVSPNGWCTYYGD
jgi:hypothetical protein